MVENRRKKGAIPHSRRHQGVPDLPASMQVESSEPKSLAKKKTLVSSKNKKEKVEEENFIACPEDTDAMEGLGSSAVNSESSSSPMKKQSDTAQSSSSPFDWFDEEDEEDDMKIDQLEGEEEDDDDNADVTNIQIDSKINQKIKEKITKTVADKDNQVPGVVYIGRIPHGFYEKEMTGYFSQFGKVLRVRVSRNKRTGKSKHYGFVEFASKKVAEIVCDTMHNYLMNGRLLQCKLMDDERVHPELFKGAGKKYRVLRYSPKDPAFLAKRAEKEKSADEDVEEKKKDRIARLLKKDEAKRDRLKELGIDYEFDGYKSQKALKI